MTKRGSVLVTALVLSSAAALVTGAAMRTTVSQSRLQKRLLIGIQARQLASNIVVSVAQNTEALLRSGVDISGSSLQFPAPNPALYGPTLNKLNVQDAKLVQFNLTSPTGNKSSNGMVQQTTIKAPNSVPDKNRFDSGYSYTSYNYGGQDYGTESIYRNREKFFARGATVGARRDIDLYVNVVANIGNVSKDISIHQMLADRVCQEMTYTGVVCFPDIEIVSTRNDSIESIYCQNDIYLYPRNNVNIPGRLFAASKILTGATFDTTNLPMASLNVYSYPFGTAGVTDYAYASFPSGLDHYSSNWLSTSLSLFNGMVKDSSHGVPRFFYNGFTDANGKAIKFFPKNRGNSNPYYALIQPVIGAPDPTDYRRSQQFAGKADYFFKVADDGSVTFNHRNPGGIVIDITASLPSGIIGAAAQDYSKIEKDLQIEVYEEGGPSSAVADLDKLIKELQRRFTANQGVVFRSQAQYDNDVLYYAALMQSKDYVVNQVYDYVGNLNTLVSDYRYSYTYTDSTTEDGMRRRAKVLRNTGYDRAYALNAEVQWQRYSTNIIWYSDFTAFLGDVYDIQSFRETQNFIFSNGNSSQYTISVVKLNGMLVHDIIDALPVPVNVSAYPYLSQLYNVATGTDLTFALIPQNVYFGVPRLQGLITDLKAVLALQPPASSGVSILHGIYDTNQNQAMNLISLDIAALNNALNGGTFGPGFDPTNFSGVVYVEFPYTDPGRPENILIAKNKNMALQLINGKGLAGMPANAVTFFPMIATNAPMYIVGDIDIVAAGGTASPCYLAADAITLLSGAWTHQSRMGSKLSLDTTANQALRQARNTVLRANIITGMIPPGYDPTLSAYNGGISCGLVRIMESWSNCTLNIYGSVICPFESEVHNNLMAVSSSFGTYQYVGPAPQVTIAPSLGSLTLKFSPLPEFHLCRKTGLKYISKEEFLAL